MPRGRKPRYWVKLDCQGILHGSINYLLTLEEQALWIKLIAFAEVCGGPPGMVQDNEDRGLPHEFIAHELHCPVKILDSMLKKMTDDNAIKESGRGVIELVNFPAYQFTEYDRQKPYRDKKKEDRTGFEDSDKYIKGKYGHMVKR